MPVLIQIDGYDPVAGEAVTLRAASVDDERVCHLDGQVWWPALASLPALREVRFDGGFGGAIETPSSDFTLAVEPWPLLARYALADARLRIWVGDAGAAWSAWALRFDGRVTAQPGVADGIAQFSIMVDGRWLDKPLLALYEGTGGAEGEAALKGQPKPLALGAPRYVPGVMIDSINSVIQLSAYGAIEDVEMAMERVVRFSASLGDYASHAALVAASIPAGQWATCKAEGKVRHGAPPIGLLSYHVKGDKAGPDGWVRLPGSLIRRIALIAGGAGRLDEASLTALDAARPWPLSLYQGDQVTAGELIQRIAASVNAVARVDWLGKLVVDPIEFSAPAMVLDSTGATLPPVASVEQVAVDAPWWRLAIGAEPTWAVHALSDIAFTATLVERGRYDPTETYREGHVTDLIDGSRWLYVNPTATSGNVPESESAFWSLLTPPADYTALPGLSAALAALDAAVDGKVTTFFQTSIPVADGAGDLWFKADTQKWYRAAVAGADEIKAGEWELAEDSGIGVAISAAAGAQATADGKVTTFYQDAEPTAEGEGDLWVRPSDEPKVIKRWDGDSWEAQTPANLAQLDPSANETLISTALPGQNVLYNGGFTLGLDEWSASGWRYDADWRGNFVSPPPGFSGTSVATAQKPINIGSGSEITISAFFTGTATMSSVMFVDVEWKNGGNGAVVSYSSDTPGQNGVLFWNESGTRIRKQQPLVAPAATDGSGFVRGYVRIVSVSDGAFVLGSRWVERIKAEVGTSMTAWSDEATTGSDVGNAVGRFDSGTYLPTNWNIGIKSLNLTGFALSDSDAGGSVTINIAATPFRLDDGRIINYPVGAIPGLAYNTIYFVWRNDPNLNGGTDYGVSTNVQDAHGTGKVYFGFWTTRATAGGSGGGGGGGVKDCIAHGMHVLTEAGPVLAEQVETGALLRTLGGDLQSLTWTPATSNEAHENQCVTIRTSLGAELTLALNTPCVTESGAWVMAANAWMVRLPVLIRGELVWDDVVGVDPVGRLPVAAIKCHNATYAAGSDTDRMILTHNPAVKP